LDHPPQGQSENDWSLDIQLELKNGVGRSRKPRRHPILGEAFVGLH